MEEEKKKRESERLVSNGRMSYFRSQMCARTEANNLWWIRNVSVFLLSASLSICPFCLIFFFFLVRSLMCPSLLLCFFPRSPLHHVAFVIARTAALSPRPLWDTAAFLPLSSLASPSSLVSFSLGLRMRGEGRRMWGNKIK